MIDKRLHPLLVMLTGIASIVFTLGSAQGSAQAADAKQADENKPVAVVNGTVLTTAEFDAFARSVEASRGQPMPREEILNTLIDRELLYQAAKAKGYDKRSDVIQELDNQKRSLLANVAVNEVLRAKPVSDEELRKVYQDRVLANKINEYKARHILVKSESEAKDIIAQLNKGADFSALAKGKSIDTASAKNGGDLGWFGPNQMVPEFYKAAAALAKGKYTTTPVKTQFGWHVILLDDVRPVTPPKFNDVKSQLQGLVENQHLSEYVKELRKKAKIETK
jgi:peptidyl-prolyl cis-trans isomerase C